MSCLNGHHRRLEEASGSVVEASLQWRWLAPEWSPLTAGCPGNPVFLPAVLRITHRPPRPDVQIKALISIQGWWRSLRLSVGCLQRWIRVWTLNTCKQGESHECAGCVCLESWGQGFCKCLRWITWTCNTYGHIRLHSPLLKIHSCWAESVLHTAALLWCSYKWLFFSFYSLDLLISSIKKAESHRPWWCKHLTSTRVVPVPSGRGAVVLLDGSVWWRSGVHVFLRQMWEKNGHISRGSSLSTAQRPNISWLSLSVIWGEDRNSCWFGDLQRRGVISKWCGMKVRFRETCLFICKSVAVVGVSSTNNLIFIFLVLSNQPFPSLKYSYCISVILWYKMSHTEPLDHQIHIDVFVISSEFCP